MITKRPGCAHGRELWTTLGATVAGKRYRGRRPVVQCYCGAWRLGGPMTPWRYSPLPDIRPFAVDPPSDVLTVGSAPK